MIKAGVAFILIGGVLGFLAVPISLLKQFGFGSILFPSAVIVGLLGTILVLVGVILDRIKEKQEEDPDDLSKY